MIGIMHLQASISISSSSNRLTPTALILLVVIVVVVALLIVPLAIFLKRRPRSSDNHKDATLAEQWLQMDADSQSDVEQPACKSCGFPMAAGAVSCPNCGSHVSAQGSAAQEASEVGTGVIQRDVVVGGAVAFRKGEIVQVEGVNPDTASPANRYVVQSAALGKKFLLSDQDLML